MGHCPKRKAQLTQEAQPKQTMQQNHVFPVDLEYLEYLSHLLPSNKLMIIAKV